MAGLALTIRRISGSTYRYDWSGTGPYEVWRRGRLEADENGRTLWTLTHAISTSSDAEEPEPIEVIDTGAASPGEAAQEAHPPYITLQWRGQANTDRYRVERYESGAWATKALRAERGTRETGYGYHRFTSRQLDDAGEEQWRITPYDVLGNAGPALEFEFEHVCTPSPPVITTSYSAGTGLLTVAAR